MGPAPPRHDLLSRESLVGAMLVGAMLVGAMLVGQFVWLLPLLLAWSARRVGPSRS